MPVNWVDWRSLKTITLEDFAITRGCEAQVLGRNKKLGNWSCVHLLGFVD
jgi:hypothetical protein